MSSTSLFFAVLFLLMQYSVNSKGALTVVSNLCIFVTILFDKDLRKKYFLILALAVADFLYGFGFLAAGIYRLMTVVDGRHKERVTRIACGETAHNVAWIISEPLVPFVSALIAVERFVAITWPIEYSKKWPTRRIIVSSTLIIYLFVGLEVVAQYLSGYLSEDCVGSLCFSSHLPDPYARRILIDIVLVCTLVSVVSYLMALYSMMKQAKKLKAGVQNRANKESIERQIRITKMMSSIIILQVIAVGLPYTVEHILVEDYPLLFGAIIPYVFAGACCNSGVNFFIYAKTNPELRAAFRKRLIPCWKASVHPATGASGTGNAGRSKSHPARLDATRNSNIGNGLPRVA